MHITQSFVYPAPLDRISTMYADPGYLLHRLDRTGVVDPHVDVTEGAGTTTVVATLTGDTSLLPSAARRFVKSGLSGRLTLTLTPRQGSSRRATLDVAISGAPVSASGAMVLTESGDTTSATIDVDFSVKIPLMGGTIEKQAVGYVRGALETEPAAAAQWLDAHPGS